MHNVLLSLDIRRLLVLEMKGGGGGGGRGGIGPSSSFEGKNPVITAHKKKF